MTRRTDHRRADDEARRRAWTQARDVAALYEALATAAPAGDDQRLVPQWALEAACEVLSASARRAPAPSQHSAVTRYQQAYEDALCAFLVRAARSSGVSAHAAHVLIAEYLGREVSTIRKAADRGQARGRPRPMAMRFGAEVAGMTLPAWCQWPDGAYWQDLRTRRPKRTPPRK